VWQAAPTSLETAGLNFNNPGRARSQPTRIPEAPNFDVETTGSIVCSELPYHVYPGVRWKTESQLGRFTISPDDIASLALGDDAAFELIVLYHDGRPIDVDADLALMEALMRDA